MKIAVTTEDLTTISVTTTAVTTRRETTTSISTSTTTSAPIKINWKMQVILRSYVNSRKPNLFQGSNIDNIELG